MQDIDSLQKVWEVMVEWNKNWDVWKVGQFTTLETESMESTVQELFKRLQKLQRELKVCSPAVIRCTLPPSVPQALSGAAVCYQQMHDHLLQM